MPSKEPRFFEVVIDKLVHGGQGIGTLDDGRKAFVWGVLPAEKVSFRATKIKKDYVEGVAENILTKSNKRLDPLDSHYLSTSPWQILEYGYENQQKIKILEEVILRAGLDFDKNIEWSYPDNDFFYRNKMEYSFYGDDDGLHLALYNRGTHQKQIITSSSIAKKSIDAVATKACEILDKHNVRAGDLKSIILRSDSNDNVVCALFVKDENFAEIQELSKLCKGFVVVYSNPKSPASIRTKDIYKYGDISLSDKLLGKLLLYDVFSFFQVNIGAFEDALFDIKNSVSDSTFIDLYSGVGSIGVSLGNAKMLIESDEPNVKWAKLNIQNTKIKLVHSKSEKALDYLNHKDTLVVDPPRAGLHNDLVEKILDSLPPKIIYLSCNPSTQVRDLALLQKKYSIELIKGYNFFPRTPHIESLAVLVRK